MKATGIANTVAAETRKRIGEAVGRGDADDLIRNTDLPAAPAGRYAMARHRNRQTVPASLKSRRFFGADHAIAATPRRFAPCRSCLESNMFLLCSYRFRIRRKESSGFLRILSLSGRPERVRCAAENPRNQPGISVYAGIWPEAAKDENGSNLPDPHLARPAFSLA